MNKETLKKINKSVVKTYIFNIGKLRCKRLVDLKTEDKLVGFSLTSLLSEFYEDFSH